MDSEHLDRLTDRQKQCLRLVRAGYVSKEIAVRIGASPDVVDKVIKLAMARIGAGNRREAARMLDDHEAGCAVRRSDVRSPDLPDDDGTGEMGPPPSPVATPPAVAEDRAIFVPDLGAAPRPAHSEMREAKERRSIRDTVNRVFQRVVQIAGILLMVLALAGLLSVAYHRWEDAHHIRPR
ncbi:helix-turn-helix domain-containing protein [Sphingomonas oryzagri]|uniref:Helix-turn-helix transcriptional regulator n=1 Tax=Sphingomonas oryzagri TaxID=3042314 RepID=A0ABT6N1R2_9SPHN|nr:helix-turn-helix transcriptional regulator [Sphingomonas oryzagri]MDH7639226.1 helix-turn-helix transcriptional regulator [Sphingomonas oryzagri]